ncbi:BLUF domain-containing protein [Hydrogenophaga flava]|uniref:BLUF domain-containing protein n=1 Tax=Hydrogenophaga flava TaxID=65657 RepID=UPI0008244C6F|nr:BLUF domain-containing protein [Hydrogenophaga flava]
MALYEIIYTSLASRDLPPEELAQLLDKARAHNASQGITGMMIYHRREFMQLLEGEQAAVQALYERIAGDPRHQQLRKIWDGPIRERGFSDWGMAFVAPDELALREKPGYQDLLAQGPRHAPSDSTGKKLLLTLRDDFL